MNDLYYVIKLDGDQWCAHYNDFINLQESGASFGDTPQVALQNFIDQRIQSQLTADKGDSNE